MDRRTALASGSGWNPRNISNLLAWYDSTFGITAPGGTVTNWKDRSPNSYNATVSSAGTRPTYSATGWKSNRPGVTFDGVDDGMFANPSALGTYPNGTGVPLTIFATLNGLSGNSNTLLQWYDNPAIATVYSYSIGVDTHLSAFDGSSRDGTHDASGYRRIAFFVGGGTLTSYVDSTLDMNGVGFSGTVSGLNTLLIGINALGTLHFSGTIAEIVISSVRLDPSVYLNAYIPYSTNKWG